MELASLRTTEKTGGPKVPQFSVHLQNRVGALQDLIRLINDHNVEVVALSVQDATDSALARLVVTDPDLVRSLLHGHDLSHSEVSVLVVELQEATQLGAMLTSLLKAEVNINFIYPMMVRPRWQAAMVVHVENNKCASTVLAADGFTLLTQADISR